MSNEEETSRPKARLPGRNTNRSSARSTKSVSTTSTVTSNLNTVMEDADVSMSTVDQDPLNLEPKVVHTHTGFSNDLEEMDVNSHQGQFVLGEDGRPRRSDGTMTMVDEEEDRDVIVDDGDHKAFDLVEDEDGKLVHREEEQALKFESLQDQDDFSPEADLEEDQEDFPTHKTPSIGEAEAEREEGEDEDEDPEDWLRLGEKQMIQCEEIISDVRKTFEDEVDYFDTTMVAEYSDDIFHYMGVLEVSRGCVFGAD